ncbi:prolyl oligopeptidase family serine peptidase [Paucibacter sp. KBW04]|uniref:S9 family peptidase n=1 Tax=Paucibacter sp. KBW04 TaxID=2153361 RepID=UPI0018CC0BAF|nr:prolyl oligopeptidase family serine peptidase [Paucibacter sp. KBW04]
MNSGGLRASALSLGLLLSGLPALGASPDAAGKANELLPVASYVAVPRFSQPSLSPDGQRLAVLAPLKGKRNLMVIDLKTRAGTALTGMSDFDVVSFQWVGSERLVFSLGRLNAPTGPESGDGGGLFTVKRDGTGFRKLHPTFREQYGRGNFQFRYMNFLATAPGSEDEVLVASNFRTSKANDIYRVNLESGQKKLLTFDQPGIVEQWILDQQGLPRVAVLADKEDDPQQFPGARVMIRAGMDAPWKQVARFEPGSPERWSVLAFAENNEDLIVSTRRGRDTVGMYRYLVAEGRFGETIAEHPRYDLKSGLRYDPKTRKVVGLSFADEQHQVAYFDENYARLQAGFEALFPGKAVSFQTTEGTRNLVTVWSDRAVPTFYIHDAEKKTLEEALRSREDVEEKHLVQMRPFLLKTRDGLEIPSYYFLPANYQPGQRLPTVLHVHGGPMMRADKWGALNSFGVTEAQLLASRGYAVILPNFRVTPELGEKIYKAGYGELGRKMSDDHEDAVRWAVAQGFADQQRVCISGASYGGYASLWATIRSADLFKCAVAGAVVSDLKLQLTSNATDFSGSKSGVAYWKRLIGVKDDNWQVAQEVSPALHAARSKVPLMIYAGADDRRTPLEQTKAMVNALTEAGRPPEIVMIKPEEGHGYGKQENWVDLYTTMLKFLDKHIGSGPTAAAAPAPQQAPAQ